MKKLIPLLLVAFFLCPIKGKAQIAAVKTNLLYGVYTYTPNLGMEFRLGKKWTLDLGAGYNPWNREGSFEDNKKLVHVLGQLEARYWLCQSFNGHFFGAHVLASHYNIGQKNLPLLFGKNSADYRFQGDAIGGGISYGYQWLLGKRWNLEATIGVGYARLMYDKYDCPKCGEKINSEHRNYFGPTKAGISIIYLIK